MAKKPKPKPKPKPKAAKRSYRSKRKAWIVNFEGELKSIMREAAKVGVERAMHELQQMRREQQSSIVIPETSALPPQGKIQLR